jgi:hypothetical protein
MSGAPESDTPFIEDDRAHAAIARMPNERDANRDFDIIVG